MAAICLINAVIIALTRLDVNELILDVNNQALDVNDQTLELAYRIMNRSSHDIWVCNSMDFIEDSSEVYLAES
jgi:hypothetical protein